MPRLTRHACLRYLIRNPDLATARLNLPRVERIAQDSLDRSQFITRDEAVARVGKMRPHTWNRYYRLDETGEGLWITCWYRGEEVVLTYLHPRTRSRSFRTAKVRQVIVFQRAGHGLWVAKNVRLMMDREPIPKVVPQRA